MPDPTKPMTAADEARAYLSVEPRPKWFNRDHVAQLLAEHDEQRDRADEAEAELAEVRAWMADPFNRVRIAPVVQRAYRQRDEAVEEAEAELEEYKADLKAAHAELAALRAQAVATEQQVRERAAAELAQIPIVQRLGIEGCDSFVKQVADKTLRYAATVVLKGGRSDA